jgi:hypothetical protein
MGLMMRPDEQRKEMGQAQNGSIPNSSKVEWEDSGPFLRKYAKSWIWLIVYNQLFIPFIFIFFLIAYEIYSPDFWNIFCGGLVACLGLIIFIAYLFQIQECRVLYINIKARSKIDTKMISCGWCGSYYSHEIRKTMARQLDDRGIPNTISRYEGENDLIKARAGNGIGNILDIELPEHGVRIGFYGPIKIIRRDPCRITIGFLPDCPLGLEERKDITRIILDIVQGIPSGNPFCSLCEGKGSSSCYGEDHPRTGDTPKIVNRILSKVDPYLFEGALEELVDRKKCYGDQSLQSKHEWMSGRPFHNILEVYGKYISEEGMEALRSEEEEGEEEDEEVPGEENDQGTAGEAKEQGDGGERGSGSTVGDDGKLEIGNGEANIERTLTKRGGVGDDAGNDAIEPHERDASIKESVGDMMKPSLGKTLIMLLGGILIMVNALVLLYKNPSMRTGVISGLIFCVGLLLFGGMVKEMLLIKGQK